MRLAVEARVAIALGTVAVGLGLYAAVLEPKNVSSDLVAERKGRVLDAVSPHEVNKIDVVVGDLAMSLARTREGWRGKEPIDAARVDAMVSMLDHAVPLRTVDTAKVGSARATYRFTFPAQTLLLTVGAETEVPPGGAYVRVDGRAMVVSRAVAETLLRSPLELIEPVVWAVAAADLRAVTIGSAPSERRLSYRKGRLFAPEGAVLARKQVEDLFSLLLTLRVERWLPAGPPLDAPLRVALETAEAGSAPDGRGTVTRSLWIGGPCPGGTSGRVARFEGGRMACVADALATAAQALAEAPADDALFSVRRDEVERVTLRVHERVFDAARKEGGFHLLQPESRALSRDEAEALEQWLDKMLAVSGKVASAQPPKSESELMVKSVDGVEERVLLNESAAYRATDSLLLAVAPGALRFAVGHDLPSEPRWLLPRSLEAKLSRVAITCGDVGYEWTAAGGRWSLSAPAGQRGFASRWDETLEALRTGKRGDEAPAPHARPLCVVRLNREPALSLFVGKDGRSVASFAGNTFEVTKRLVDVVDRDFIDPGCLLGDRDREVQTATVVPPLPQGSPSARIPLSMGDLLGIVEGARVARVGAVDRVGRPLAEWGDKVVVGSRRDHGRMFARCGNEPVTFSIDEAAVKRALGLSKDAD